MFVRLTFTVRVTGHTKNFTWKLHRWSCLTFFGVPLSFFCHSWSICVCISVLALSFECEELMDLSVPLEATYGYLFCVSFWSKSFLQDITRVMFLHPSLKYLLLINSLTIQRVFDFEYTSISSRGNFAK